MSMPLFRKSHFEILAEALKAHGGKLTASDLADLLEQLNPKFNRKRFLDAATHIS